MEILIVEDSLTQAANLRSILERQQFRVRMASHGAQALTSLEKALPRLVISDILMPEMDGYELCRRIKADERFSHLPVILLTSLSDLKDVIKGLECGADSFVVKPYEEQHLLARIQYIVANGKLRERRKINSTHEGKLELFFGGHSHVLSRLPNVENAIDLLLGAYEILVEKNSALAQAKEEADRANRAKSDFLSRMSHELRTPMNAILGFAQVLEMEETDPSKGEALEQIIKGGKHLLDLINEVLDISSIEAGRLTFCKQSVGIEEVLQEAVGLIAPLANARRIRIEDKCLGNGRRHILVDRQRFKQVLINLLSNAVKYNRYEGCVTLSCEQTAFGRMRIKIADTGAGIAKDDLPRLFVSFERLNAGCSSTEGTGLGLALSKRLVELMGGEIGVESVPGQGSVFWVEMELMASSPDHTDTSVSSSAVSDGSQTVLYIEDNLSNLKLIQRLMSRRPAVNLISAVRGKLGLELAQQHRPDLILLDLHLPDIPGHDVLARLRADPATDECPVVVISADATAVEIDRLRSAGAKHYLTKPLDVKQFLAVLDDTLGFQNARDAVVPVSGDAPTAN